MLATKPMNQPLTQARILRFYLPLVFNSILMTIEIPVVTAGISRLPDAEVHLAGLGIIVALSFTLTNLGVPLTHTGNALGRSLQAFKLLRWFSLGVCGAMALISGLIYFTPLYAAVVQGLLGVPEFVATSARPGVQMMLIASFAIAWRRFYHGVLIRHGYTSVVGWVTMIRAATLLSITFAGVSLGRLTGMELAGLALAGSAAVECAVVNVVAEVILRRPRAIRWESDRVFSLTYGATLRFFLPLALVLVLSNSARPIITASMTRLPEPVLSLAAFPVAYGVFNVVFSPLWVLTQLVIALVKDAQSYQVVVAFVRRACVIGWLLLLGATFTPAVGWYLEVVLRVPADVRIAALPAIRIMSFYILVAGVQTHYQGLLVGARRTSSTQIATLMNLLTASTVLVAGVFWGGLQGVLLGALAYVAGFSAEAVALRWQAAPVVRELTASAPADVGRSGRNTPA
ncbi:MAG: hypothetical protein ACYC3S_16020 [Chloroflexota bacterium]